MPYTPTVVFAPAGIDACGLYRMFMPHLNLPNSRFMFTSGIPSLNEMAESDIICVQRLMTDANMKFLQAARAFGMRIVYDLDDNVWQIPKDNPAEYIFKQNAVRQGMAACAEWADVLTCSTQTLKKVVERNWGHITNAATKKEIPVIVCENKVDPNFFNYKLPEDKEFVTIGWAGSNTHAGDLRDIWPILFNLLEKHPQLKVELVGHSATFEHPRLTVRPWVHVSAYSFCLSHWNWDIFMAPLEGHKFNNAKSSLKMQEAGILGRPCIASWMDPYDEFCGDDADLRFQLCSAPVQFGNRLERLIVDKDYRWELGKKMRERVLTAFNIHHTPEQWSKVFEAAYA